jgi:PAS domain S-box-containing protein
VYALFGGLWIYLSDTFLDSVVSDPAIIARISMFKGLVFIALTATLLYVLIARYVKQIGIHLAESKQAQELLARQKELLDIVVEGTTDAVYIKDLEGRYLLANAAVTKFFKKPLSEIIGNDDTQLFPFNEALSLMTQDQWAMAQSSPQMYEEQFTTPDGVRYFLSTKGAVHDENGAVSGLFGVARDITERKQSEEALRKSEDKFSKAFKASPEAMAIGSIDDGRYLDVNDVFLEITGYQREEVLGHTSAELGFWIDLEARKQCLEELSRNGFLKNIECRLRMKNNEERDFLISSEIIEIEGKPCSLNFILDITERKQAENDLKDSEYFFKESQRSAKIGSFKYDITSDYWKPSDILRSILGIDESYNSNFQGWVDLVHPDDREMMVHYVGDEVIAKRKPYSKEYRITRKNDGESRWVNGLGEVKCDGTGKVVMLIGTIQDITPRKQAEEELTLFFDLVPDMVCIASTEGFFKKINRAWEAVLGYTQEELLKVPFLDLIHPDDVSATLGEIKKQIAGESTINFINRYRCKDGSYCWLEWVTTPAMDKSILYAVARDITERKRAEQEKKVLEQQLLHAQKMESLGVLSGGIAHDFNNILAIITGHCYLVELDYETTGEHIPAIKLAAERAAGLCRQMLTYAGKGQYVLAPLNIGKLVDEMATMLKATIRQNVVLRLNLPADIPIIKGDDNQIRQVVMNLIINASEAIGEAQGEIRISLARAEIREGQSEKDHLDLPIPPGIYVCLEVDDNGSGMDDETKQRLFEPFYTTKFSGRGLGMSATLGIITAHKGALQFSSELGKGTTFKVFLPISLNVPAENHPAKHVASSVPWQGGGTILLAEDDEQVRMIARIMLEELGFSVIEASDGKMALELYRKNAAVISIVMTDIGMPVIDGYTLFRELKMIKPDLPIIISSGFGDISVTTKIPRKEISGLVCKPFNFDHLREVMKGALQGCGG